jgi:hypothetical protein
MRFRSRCSPRSFLARAAIGAAVAACALAPRDARGDDAATAQALFDEATALKAKEDWAGACPKFESSYRLDPALGTLLNLANCFEKLDKIASAWARWEEAYQWATKNGDDRAEYAKKNRDALAPRLPKLKINVTGRAAALSIERDTSKVSDAMYGVPLPVDPGEHTVFVKRDDEVLRTEKIKIAEAQSAELSFDLAAIEKAAPPPKAKRDVVVVGASPALRKVGWGVGAAGVAGLLVAGTLEGIAISRKGRADEECVDKICTATGKQIADEGVAFAEAGQWVGIASLVVVAVGVTLLIVTPSVAPEAPAAPRKDAKPRRDVWAAPWIAPEVGAPGGIGARGGIGVGGGLVIGGHL